jgi:hypothetical protein
MTDRACQWPKCQAPATVHGKTRTANVYLCAPHGIDVMFYRDLALHLDELSTPALAKYDRIRDALGALGIETACRTIGEWL